MAKVFLQEYRCLEKRRDKQGNIIGYRLERVSDKHIDDVTPDQLKSAIRHGQVEVKNLTLTSDNRLVDTSESDDFTTICEVDNAIGGGVVKQFATLAGNFYNKMFLSRYRNDENKAYVIDSSTERISNMPVSLVKHLRATASSFISNGEKLRVVAYDILPANEDGIDDEKLMFVYAVFTSCEHFASYKQGNVKFAYSRMVAEAPCTSAFYILKKDTTASDFYVPNINISGLTPENVADINKAFDVCLSFFGANKSVKKCKWLDIEGVADGIQYKVVEEQIKLEKDKAHSNQIALQHTCYCKAGDREFKFPLVFDTWWHRDDRYSGLRLYTGATASEYVDLADDDGKFSYNKEVYRANLVKAIKNAVFTRSNIVPYGKFVSHVRKISIRGIFDAYHASPLNETLLGCLRTCLEQLGWIAADAKNTKAAALAIVEQRDRVDCLNALSEFTFRLACLRYIDKLIACEKLVGKLKIDGDSPSYDVYVTNGHIDETEIETNLGKYLDHEHLRLEGNKETPEIKELSKQVYEARKYYTDAAKSDYSLKKEWLDLFDFLEKLQPPIQMQEFPTICSKLESISFSFRTYCSAIKTYITSIRKFQEFYVSSLDMSIKEYMKLLKSTLWSLNFGVDFCKPGTEDTLDFENEFELLDLGGEDKNLRYDARVFMLSRATGAAVDSSLDAMLSNESVWNFEFAPNGDAMYVTADGVNKKTYLLSNPAKAYVAPMRLVSSLAKKMNLNIAERMLQNDECLLELLQFYWAKVMALQGYLTEFCEKTKWDITLLENRDNFEFEIQHGKRSNLSLTRATVKVKGTDGSASKPFAAFDFCVDKKGLSSLTTVTMKENPAQYYAELRENMEDLLSLWTLYINCTLFTAKGRKLKRLKTSTTPWTESSAFKSIMIDTMSDAMSQALYGVTQEDVDASDAD